MGEESRVAGFRLKNREPYNDSVSFNQEKASPLKPGRSLLPLDYSDNRQGIYQTSSSMVVKRS